jgi:hypothetical protein
MVARAILRDSQGIEIEAIVWSQPADFFRLQQRVR